LHFCISATDRQTDRQMDSANTLSRSHCREQQLNNLLLKLISHWAAPVRAEL